MTQSLARCITVEHFNAINKKEDNDPQRGTTELSLREVVHELHGVLEGVACITLCEVTVGDRDSRLTVSKSESIRITCKELGIASLPLDEILVLEWVAVLRAHIKQTLRRAVGLLPMRNLTQNRCRWR
jgi:hypothetical protein